MIIAVDFDGTLFESNFPDIGKPKLNVINYVKHCKTKGDIIILWTCRCGEHLDQALAKCAEYDITFDYVNENARFDKSLYKYEGRKIYADIYLDDHSINPESL